MSNDTFIKLTSMSITTVISILCLILYMNKNNSLNKELKDKKTSNSRRVQIKKECKNRDYNIKIFVIKVCAFFSVEVTCTADLYAKQLIKESECLNNFIRYSIEGGVIVLIGMLIFSYFMRLIIKCAKILPKNKTKQDLANTFINDYHDVSKRLQEMTVCSYKFAIIVMIIMLSIMGKSNSAINWGIILAGKYIWFGEFDITTIQKKGNKNQYMITYHDIITYSVLTIFTIPLIFSLQYGLKFISNIIFGIASGLMILGIIVIVALRKYL
ncbi:MAG: hypothetical protein E7C05_03020 [Clostridium botulinum]|uniref:Uncharacterized protein n=1 Tax=Clostridium botulinum B2 450 TaxID=1379739 RepID=A0A0D1BW40_CLOBO|nr:hypothetical protein [Clostridium botulinum]KIS24002.1 hypothetical protein N495_10510 [Clostridium botulinum B2 450]MBE6075727.1 hypothetical protein [Clostridium lundense]MDU2831527.1 hypothetical protein [Clostridium botulinum]MDU5116401.1 hypothetical protein [Clostridium botulinum]